MMNLKLTIPDYVWTESGDEDNPKARLLARIKINDADFHLEAVAVTENANSKRQDEPELIYDDAPDWIQAAIAASADYEPVQTVEIKGRHYVLIATPFQQ